MSETNQRVVRQFYNEVIAGGRFELVARLFAPDYVDHELVDAAPGVAGAERWFQAFAAAFRNRAVVIEDVIAEGDLVSVRWSASLEHTTSFLGDAPTRRWLEVSGLGVFRVRDGWIVERWQHDDGLSLLQQLHLLSRQQELAASTPARELVTCA